MIGPNAASLFFDHIALRLILSVTTSAIWLSIVIILIKLLRIRNSNVKYALWTIPLIKGLLAVITDIPVTNGLKGAGLFYYFKLPDFGMVAASHWWEKADALSKPLFYPTASLSPIALSIILALALGLLVWRLIGLVRFLAMIKKSKKLDRSKYVEFFQILDRLVARAQISSPRVISVESSGTPFTVGIRKPIIAVSVSMMAELEPPEIEAVLAHEISHIIRKDHLFHWPVVILRDILYFNPISHFLYPRISFEKERACDQIASRTIKPVVLAKSIVKIAEMQRSKLPLPLVKRYAPQSLVSERDSLFALRITELVEQSSPLRSHGVIERMFIIGSILTLVIVDFRLIAIIDSYIFVIS